jgi:uncharacterized protein YgiM (DUF1202 family)
MMEVPMRKTSRFKMLFIGVAVLCVALLLAQTLVIKVQSTHVRKEPKFYSSPVATLKAGDSVTQISSQAGWFKVRTSKGVEGWIHSQAVATGKLAVAAMDKSVKMSATADEVALAGKGFNRQVEESYKSRNKGLNFGEVDRMLRIKVTPDELRRFLMDGKLAEFGGAR